MTEPPVPPAKTQNSRSNLIILGLVVFAIYAVFSQNGGGDGGGSTSPTRLPRITPSSYNVTYRVTTNRARVDLTYSNESENTEQIGDASTPWVYSFRASPGQFLYVSAQSQLDGNDAVACEILLNGTVIESAQSEGRFVIASCSGSAR